MGVAKGEVGVAKDEVVGAFYRVPSVCAPLCDGGGRPGQSHEQAVPKLG